MKILIADDHSLIIEGFVNVIKNHDATMACFTASNKIELFEILKSQQIDILFQDILFGKTDARDFIKQIKTDFPMVKIIIISTLNDLFTLETVLKQGVDGYFVKSDSSREIINAIDTILEGNKYLSKDLLQQKNCSYTIKSNTIILTPREKEILCLILQERTTKEIAKKLFISDKTVENHRTNLFIKFGVKNLAGLVKCAILEGFL
ncbi:LuxR C-terminal-related transcriptional regulator [Flavobacterium sp. JP2137]|uniref:LuxR C-terminal-related transcriptional regulator n=1 Tax=Flavobacterium sp. JP2137 TaxID=3414510 RepID=UPI003D2FB181